jgi:hypothetical protein
MAYHGSKLCVGCGAEDCVCCEVYLEEQASTHHDGGLRWWEEEGLSEDPRLDDWEDPYEGEGWDEEEWGADYCPDCGEDWECWRMRGVW